LAIDSGKLCVIRNGSGDPCYVFRYWEILPDGTKVRRKREVGKVDSMSRERASEIVAPWLVAAEGKRPGPLEIVTVGDLIAHFREVELWGTPGMKESLHGSPKEDDEDDDQDEDEDGDEDDEEDDFDPDERASSTRRRYENLLKSRIEPRWSKVKLVHVIAGQVEAWLHSLRRKPRKKKEQPEVPVQSSKARRKKKKKEKLKRLAPGSKAKIRDLMSLIFNHAIRWGLYDKNPISGPARKAGVRQSAKRKKEPVVLTLAEMRRLLSKLSIRERALISTDMITGIRRGELAGLKWKDVDFKRLLLNIRRSVVDQVTGRCKTEASAKPVPIDDYTAKDLLAWYRVTRYRLPNDWVFATDSARAGEKRGKQPLWLSKVMQYHIQPLVKRLGIEKRVSWHTFRHTFTTLLTANKEDVKVVQELLRHASAKVTLDIYAHARMEDKRRAQQRIVKRLREPERRKNGRKRAPSANGRRPKRVRAA
jgi:integrase